MDPRLLHLYTEELAHVREMGAEFALEYPKIAARLGMEGVAVADPYVERLIEGFAFVAARIRLKLDAEFPRFSEQLLNVLFPQFLAPVPAAGIVQFSPKPGSALMSAPVSVPRHTALRAPIAKGESTACEFRTCHALSLWPLTLTEARVFSFAPDLALNQRVTAKPVRGGLRLRLNLEEGLQWKDGECDELSLHVASAGELAFKLYELMLADCQGLLVLDSTGAVLAQLDGDCVQADGFEDAQSLLPSGGRQFVGFRLLLEYFAYARRFLFVRLRGLKPHLRRLRPEDRHVELVILSAQGDPSLETQVDASHIVLNATPVVNLFERAADRILVSDEQFEHHLVVDRARPADHEVHSVLSLRGFRRNQSEALEFLPFYAGHDAQDDHGGQAFFSVRREPTVLSSRQLRRGTRTSYVGSEVYLSLVDATEAPYAQDLDQLAARVLVSNRDLALLISAGSTPRLNVENLSSVDEARLIDGPSRPHGRSLQAQHPWRLINHLGLNATSLIGGDQEASVAALQELLELYVQEADQASKRQITGLRKLSSRAVVRRLPSDGPIAFVRGIESTCTVDETAFAGAGAFLFASVLERFLAHHVTINSFSQLVLVSEQRGELARWRARSGQKVLL